MPDDPTPASPFPPERRAAAKARCDACAGDEWRGRAVLTWTAEGPGHSATVWYDDGDACAKVHGNLGLGFGANAFAELFAHALADIPDALAAIDCLEAEVARLRDELRRVAPFLAMRGIGGYRLGEPIGIPPEERWDAFQTLKGTVYICRLCNRDSPTRDATCPAGCGVAAAEEGDDGA